MVLYDVNVHEDTEGKIAGIEIAWKNEAGEIIKEITITDSDELNQLITDVRAVEAEILSDESFLRIFNKVKDEIEDFPVISESYFSNNTVRYMLQNGLNIQAGHVGVQIPSANSIGNSNVTFNNVFAETPIVVGINQTSGPNMNNSGVGNISTTGFTAYVSGPTSGQTITFKWIAIGRTL